MIVKEKREKRKEKNGEAVAPPFDLLERAGLFCNRCIQVSLSLPNNGVCWEIARQLTRCSGSIGANAEEAHGTTTKNDFTYRMSVSLREARETRFWLRRIRDNKLLEPGRLDNLLQESEELVAILITIVRKSRTS